METFTKSRKFPLACTGSNKWWEDRITQEPVNKTIFDNMHNSKYLATVTELVKDNFAPKLLQWCAEISEENKKGLRVLKTVLELKGEKRFRRQARGTGQSVDARKTVDNDLDGKDYNAAKQTFRKTSNVSSYNRQFGDRPKEEEAYHIIKKKKFSELDFASILKPGPCAMIEKWIIGDSE